MIFLCDRFKNILAFFKGSIFNRIHGDILQMIHTKIRETEEVRIIMIASFCSQIQLLEFKNFLKVREQFFRDLSVIDQSGSRSDASFFKTLTDLLYQVARKFIINIEFCISGEFDRVRTLDLKAGKDLMQVVPNDVVLQQAGVVANDSRYLELLNILLNLSFAC